MRASFLLRWFLVAQPSVKSRVAERRQDSRCVLRAPRLTPDACVAARVVSLVVVVGATVGGALAATRLAPSNRRRRARTPRRMKTHVMRLELRLLMNRPWDDASGVERCVQRKRSDS